MRTPYRSRRVRRCSSPRCAHGGRIRVGQEVIRYGRHDYMHTDDVAPLLAWFTHMADAVADVVDFAMPAMIDWFAAVREAFSGFARSVASPLLREQAEADAAHLVDLLWDEDVSVRPSEVHPGAVWISKAGRWPGSPRLLSVLAATGAQYDVVDHDAHDAHATVRLTRTYRERHGLGLFAPADHDDEDVYA